MGCTIHVSRKFKLAFDGRCAQYHGHGVANYCRGLIRAFAELSDQFDYLFVLDANLPTDHIIFPSKSEFIYTTVGKASWALRDFWEQFILPRKLTQAGVHLYHGFDYTAPIRRTSFAKVVTFHDATVFTPLDDRGWISRTRLTYLLHSVAANVDAIVTDSDFSMRELETHVPDCRGRIARIWCGVGETFFKPYPAGRVEACLKKAEAHSNFVLYYGGFARHKNVGVLLRAFQTVARAKRLRLVLVGPLGAAQPDIEETIRFLNLSDKVTLFGFAEEEELKILLDRCALFAFPSLREGFGLPVAEAMALGAPIVCSNKGSLPEIAGDAALYFDPSEPEYLALAMSKVLEDGDLRDRLKREGYERSQQFLWSNATAQLSHLYLRLIEQRLGTAPPVR